MEIKYLSRAISDHSPLMAEFRISESTPILTRWRINPFWLTLFTPTDRIPDQLQVFLDSHDSLSDPHLLWETLKAYLRGCIKSSISFVKKNSSRVEVELETHYTQTELAYIADPSEESKGDWLQAGRQYLNHLQEKARRSQFFMKQRYYEWGNQSSTLLAHLVHQNSSSQAVLRIKTPTGTVLLDNHSIRNGFQQFYADLYQSQISYTKQELVDYLNSISFPALSLEDRTSLDAPFTLSELTDALKNMARGKSPGPDGIPLEVYLKYQESLLPALLAVFNSTLSREALPNSFYEATIVIILKPDKNPEDCGSYRPISLLNIDYKLLTKMLACRLARIIHSLIHPDQTGFMPSKSTTENIRRAQVITQLGYKGRENWALASLDATKAFDSVEWPYLLHVLGRFGFGETFIKWVSLLYKKPRAAVLVNGAHSPYFNLCRGTRQGCPLSPLLFALAIEPLAIALRGDPLFTGISVGMTVDKVALYADDLLLFVTDPRSSLSHVMSRIDVFGRFSGLCINWSKSYLMPLSPGCMLTPGESICGLQISSSFKYLGIHIPNDYKQFLLMNVDPLLELYKSKFKIWSSLPLSIAGRINLIKMIVLPKCLYVLQHSSVPVPKAFFRKLESLMAEFIWGRARHKLRISTLQRPKHLGGTALPDLFIYYVAGQLRLIRGWFSDAPLPNSEAQLACILGIQNMWPLLEYPHLYTAKLLPIHRLALQIWKHSKSITHFNDIIADMPLWHNPGLSELLLLPDTQVWRSCGVTKLEHLYNDDVFASFEQLQTKCELPRSYFFRYLQLRHALSAQFPAPRLRISSYPLIGILRSQGPRGLISALYTHLIMSKVSHNPLPALNRWKERIPSIDDDTLQDIMESPLFVSPAVNNRLVQLNIIHQCYLTPVRLHRMGRSSSASCLRCSESHADFWHMIWECPVIRDFWREVVVLLSGVLDCPVPDTPEVCLFGVLDEENWQHHTRIFLRETLFFARKAIALRWMAPRPPSLFMWKNLVNSVVPYNSIIYKGRGCPDKFRKVWQRWCDSPLTIFSPSFLTTSLQSVLGGGD